jgi:hypothetical protein
MLGRGSNPAHGDIEAIEVATNSAEVFALPKLGDAPEKRTTFQETGNYP